MNKRFRVCLNLSAPSENSPLGASTKDLGRLRFNLNMSTGSMENRLGKKPLT
jgi:hypothetical protein